MRTGRAKLSLILNARLYSSHVDIVPLHIFLKDLLGAEGNSILANMPGAVSNFPVQTRQVAYTINGIHTELILSSYDDRIFVAVTQLGKLGTLVRCFHAGQVSTGLSPLAKLRFFSGTRLSVV